MNFLDRFSKTDVKIPNFMKIRPVRAELFHADGRMDGQTGMKKLIVAFRDFLSAPNNGAGKNRETKRATCYRANSSITCLTLSYPRFEISNEFISLYKYNFMWNKSVKRHKLQDCLLWCCRNTDDGRDTLTFRHRASCI